MISRRLRRYADVDRTVFWKAIIRLLLDLAVVFIGVYLAFLLTTYQKEREARSQQQQLFCAATQELTDFVAVAEEVVPAISEMNETWLESYEAGEMPLPPYPTTGAIDRPSTILWEAALESGAIGYIDISLMHRLSTFYHAQQLILAKGDHLGEYAWREILPFVSHPETLYDIESRRLKPQYAEYVRLQHEISSSFASLLDEARALERETAAGCTR